MKKTLVCLALCGALLAACGTPSAPQPTIDVNAVQTAAVASQIALFTQNAPTNTPAPTNTLEPTNTPLPTATATPAPQPIILTGTGDSVVDVDKWDSAAILHVKYVGGGNFAIRNYPVNSNDYIDLLVNTIGSYEGTLLIDIFDNEHTARFEVFASGPWEIQVLPFESIRKEIIPGVIRGNGDDVFIIGGSGKPDLLKVDASQASRNLAIFSFTTSGRDLLVNKIAPYTGTAVLDPDTLILVVKATGPWSLDVTTK